MTDNQREADCYLSQIRNADKEITDMILQIDYLRYKASGMGAIRYDKDHVQTSPKDMVCDAITEAVQLEQQLSARHKELMAMRQRATEIISLWNDKEARAIEIYYLNHGSMVDIARQIKCTDRNAYHVRQRALERFHKML